MSLNVEVKFGSDRHRKILEAVLERIKIAEKAIDEKSSDFDSCDEAFTSYIPETEADALIRGKREEGKPQYTTIMVPYTYAIAMTAHTYLASVFLTRNPIFQFSARHGEPASNVLAVEALIDYQIQVGGAVPPFFVWILDPLKYGYGVIGLDWEEEKIVISSIEERPKMYAGFLPIPGKTERIRVTKEGIGYVGNKIYNINPRDFLPDPRVSLFNYQQGEFCGVRRNVSWNEIVKKAEAGEFFNVAVVERMKATAQSDYGIADKQMPEPGDVSTPNIKNVATVKLHRLFIELIPADWGLGPGRYPEKWVVTVADKRVIVELRPYPALHGRYPFFINVVEPEAYAMFAKGMIETLKPLQYTLDWLLNTHFYNVRKALNDMLVVDPSLIYMSDLNNPVAGRLIRLRPKAYAANVSPDKAVHQLQVTDITKTHVADLMLIGQFMQRATGVTDNVMGMLNQGGRRTATEVRTTTTFGVNRLKTIAELMSATGWAPLAQVMLQMSQQYYDIERKFRIAGDLIQQNSEESFLNVTPESIQGFYDFVAVDGTMPVDRYAQANLWREFMLMMQKSPALMAQYDIARIFSWVAQLAGLKNINQFKIDIQSPAALAQAAAAGNVVPLSEVQGGSAKPGAETGAGPGDIGGVSEPGQVSGMGQTG